MKRWKKDILEDVGMKIHINSRLIDISCGMDDNIDANVKQLLDELDRLGLKVVKENNL